MRSEVPVLVTGVCQTQEHALVTRTIYRILNKITHLFYDITGVSPRPLHVAEK